MPNCNITSLISDFLNQYDATAKDEVWKKQSGVFRQFWSHRVMAQGVDPISDDDSDLVIRILDRNGKGTNKDSESVARAMVSQGAWRRMFNEFRTNKALAELINSILSETSSKIKAKLIDQLYENNKERKNNLTGPSGNTINVFLAAFDPFNNLSVISLKDRQALLQFFEIKIPFDWDLVSVGYRIVYSNTLLFNGITALGLVGSARTASAFCYSTAMRALWRGEHTIKNIDKNISVTVPTKREVEDDEEPAAAEIRQSFQIQSTLAEIGARMGFKIWLPKADRSRVLKIWSPESDKILLEELPLINDDSVLKTIEQIDVIWIKGRTIVRAFEVEQTTSIYSGLLRMADLLALQPNLNIALNIVAPSSRREKVFQEIKRPVFQLMEGGALSEKCGYLSYECVGILRELKHLEHVSPEVINEYEERAQEPWR